MIGGAEAAHAGIDLAGQPALAMGGAQQFRRHHRRQAERQQGGEGHRRCNGDGQLDEQSADVTWQEHQRGEHTDQNDRGGDDGEEHLTGAAHGGDRRRLALVDTPLDVLDHDNGVVDHKADAQHQGQQGQKVQREAERRQDDEAGKQADRGDDGRDQRRAPAAQEDEVDQGHQEQGDTHGDPDFMDGLRGKLRAVHGDNQLRAGGQDLVDAGDLFLGELGDLQVVGLALAGQRDTDLEDTVALEQPATLVRSFLDAGDIAQPGDIGRVVDALALDPAAVGVGRRGAGDAGRRGGGLAGGS